MKVGQRISIELISNYRIYGTLISSNAQHIRVQTIEGVFIAPWSNILLIEERDSNEKTQEENTETSTDL